MGRTSWDLEDDYQAERRLIEQRGAALNLIETFSADEFKDSLKSLDVPQRFRDSLEDFRNWIVINYINNRN